MNASRPASIDPMIARYAARPAPRYTSYPTAPQMRPGFTTEAWAGWLSGVEPTAPVSLYLHVPFCRKMCWYCGCNMKLVARESVLDAYVEDLLAEIDLVAAALPGRMSVGHLHFGGGTPTALSPQALTRVMARLSLRFDFAEDAEIAIESDPRTLTPEMIETIGALGFTRASFGVQEFDPAVQAAINRIQPPEMVAAAVAGLRRAGVASVNFDLIYGLPKQTVAALENTARLCAAMRPDRLALFGYAHVPWMAKNQRMIADADLPGAAERIAQAEAAAAALRAEGYAPIGIDHFALPGDALTQAARAGGLRRNFQGYTTDAAGTLIPFGATAIGRTREGIVQNLAETGAWSRAVREGRLPVAKAVALDDDDRARAWVIERLMCDFAADMGEATRRFARPEGWWSDAAAALAPMVADGLATVEGERVALTPRGRPLARVAASAFDAYLGAGARHSVAV
ncbi:oxygen-independent coproporphyrinogen III oxidase [Rubrimonas cliftonensis]|uniref:Coproporphyrinogen-III oxidase n=1 Tax=Rubrimonas cliftonensis TaxID=89524 RepID=A0A1H4E2W6_9RHOB|nr:oxygen-independent coproporphyrinogen III oxidase [Rubrimonas cliftonensis]SEA79394.1 coproporphyrinogen III oxidase, anaerobic [Rubrimonas cliftonensis]